MRGRRLHVKPGLAEAGSARRARSCQRFGRPRPSGEKGTSEAPGQGSSTRYWENTSPCRFWIGIEGDESARGSMRRANRRTQAMAWARTTSGRRGRRGLRTDERALRKAQKRRLPLRCHARPYSPPGILPADERCGRHEGPCDVASERFSRREASAKSALPKAAIARSTICKQSKAAPRSPTGRFRTATLRGAASVMNRLKFSDIVPQAARRQLKAPGKASFPFVSVHYFEKTPIYLPQRAQERLGANGTVQYRRKLSDSLPCRERRIRRKLQMP